MNRERAIAKSAAVVLAMVLLSRLLGFAREWMVARQIASGVATDAYYAAFTLPDFLNYLVASSALEVILVPIFAESLAERREDEAWHVFSTVVTVAGLTLAILIAGAEIFTPSLVHALVPGFSNQALGRAIFLTRLMLPAQFFLCLGVVFVSAQVAHSKFLVGCLGAAVSNATILLLGWILAPKMGVTGFAIGVLAGSIGGFFLLQIFGLRRVGARFSPNLDLRHPQFRRFLRRAVPLMLALSVVVTDDWMLRWFGSCLQPASVTWLSYAKMLARIPMSTIGYAVGLASFPHLSDLYAKGHYPLLNATIHRTLRALSLILLPVAALTVVLHKPLTYFIFSHTRLAGPGLDATAATLAAFAFGIVGFGTQGLLSRAFYATGDTITPAVIGTAFTFAGIPVYWYCGRRWAHLGLAAASSCVITLFALCMFAALAHRTRDREAWSMAGFVAKVIVASVVAGAASYGVAHRLGQWVDLRHTSGALNLLVPATFVGFSAYLIAAFALQIPELSPSTQNFRWQTQRISQRRAIYEPTPVLSESDKRAKT